MARNSDQAGGYHDQKRVASAFLPPPPRPTPETGINVNVPCSPPEGELGRDSTASPALECLCESIICGCSDPSKSFFTERVSVKRPSRGIIAAGRRQWESRPANAARKCSTSTSRGLRKRRSSACSVRGSTCARHSNRGACVWPSVLRPSRWGGHATRSWTTVQPFLARGDRYSGRTVRRAPAAVRVGCAGGRAWQRRPMRKAVWLQVLEAVLRKVSRWPTKRHA